MKTRCAGTGSLCFFAIISSALATNEASIKKIPVCAGLTIFTAISRKEGDYESIKTITSVDSGKVQLKYSSEQPPEQVSGGLRIRKLNISRIIRVNDLIAAKDYEEIFGTNIPAEIPGTTAIGTSRAVLLALRSKGEAQLGMFEVPALPGAAKMSADPKQHPSVFDYVEKYKLHTVVS